MNNQLRHIGQRGEFGTALRRRRMVSTRAADRCPNRSTERGHVGQQAGVGESEYGDLGQRLGARRTGQVVDIGASETQDGLTPVIITL